MHKGTIITYRPNRDDGRGFGLITPDAGGPDLFFSSASAEGTMQALLRRLRAFRYPGTPSHTPFDALHRGQRVTFVRGENARQAGRDCAEQVRPIEA
jgi:cold shock CspA family protein